MATTYEPVWDVTINGTGFLLANGDDRPYLRETTPARRDRFDAARDPGDNSLDSALWIRSQTSWHYGAGQAFAEPLETGDDIARFQYWRSYGADTMGSPGKVTTLPDVAGIAGELRSACVIPGSSGSAQDLIVFSYQQIPSLNQYTGYMYFPGGTLTNTLTQATYALTPDETGSYVYCINSSNQLCRILPTSASITTISTTAIPTLHDISYSHDRLWYTTDEGLWELPSPATATALPAAPSIAVANATFMAKAGKAIFLLVGGNVCAVGVNSDGTLSALKRVVSISGEVITAITSHMDNWLILTTTAGVRICDSTDPFNVIVGPLTISSSDWGNKIGGVAGSGNYIYVGVSNLASAPGGAADSIGLLRIDLTKKLVPESSNAARYAYTPDIYTKPGYAYSPYAPMIVMAGSYARYSEGIAYYGPSYGLRSYLLGSSTTKVTSCWVESGQINFDTSEKKAWLGVKVDVGGSSGTVRVYATGPAGVEYEITPGAVNTPVDAYYSINNANLPPSTWLRYRVLITGNAELYSIGVQATPLPKRTRYIKLPLECFDNQLDRNNVAVGYEGFGYERLTTLEALEEAGGFVTLVDNRTGESKRCVIDRVSYEGTSPPDRSKGNFGGIVSVTLLSV